MCWALLGKDWQSMDLPLHWSTTLFQQKCVKNNQGCCSLLRALLLWDLYDEHSCTSWSCEPSTTTAAQTRLFCKHGLRQSLTCKRIRLYDILADAMVSPRTAKNSTKLLRKSKKFPKLIILDIWWQSSALDTASWATSKTRLHRQLILQERENAWDVASKCSKPKNSAITLLHGIPTMRYIWTYILYILSNYLIYFLPSIWHSISDIFWHSIWHSIWHTFWQSIEYSIWLIFWDFVWHSIWHLFLGSIWRREH